MAGRSRGWGEGFFNDEKAAAGVWRRQRLDSGFDVRSPPKLRSFKSGLGQGAIRGHRNHRGPIAGDFLLARGLKGIEVVLTLVDSCYSPTMRRRAAWLLACFSGVYLVIAGPIPDPLPFIDEATALLIFVKSMGYLGYDVRRWLPFMGKGKGSKTPPAGGRRDVTIDV
jgi:hypothetical protein